MGLGVVYVVQVDLECYPQAGKTQTEKTMETRSKASPFHCFHHAPGQCHHEEHHVVMATAGAAQWPHPGL